MCADADRPDACRSVWRRARREHRCYACREAIRPGDRHRYTSGIWSREPASYRHCARCWTLLAALERMGAEPVLGLDCGETLESIGLAALLAPEVLDRLHALAFVTRDEAQALAVGL